MKVAYFCVSYPVLSQTFIQREVEAMAAHGAEMVVCSMLPWKTGRRGVVHPGVRVETCDWRGMLFSPLALLFACCNNPRGVLRFASILLRFPPKTAAHAFHVFWGIFFALSVSRNAWMEGVSHFHGAWATMPATAAWILSALRGTSFSFGAHAYDIYRDGGDPLLVPKTRATLFVHTDAAFNVPHFEKLMGGSVPKVKVIRRGLPSFPAETHKHLSGRVLHILSVARLVPKKGHLFQVAVCGCLKRMGVPFEMRIVGDGSLRETLAVEIASAGLGYEVHLVGACCQEEVQEHFRWADLFLHTGVVDAQGDRDGLPNVIPEAFSHGLAVVSCPEDGAREAVVHEKTGLIAAVKDPSEWAALIAALASSPETRVKLGKNARAWAEQNYSAPENAKRLLDAMHA